MDVVDFFDSENIPFLVFLLLSRRAFIINNDCRFPVSDLHPVLQKGFNKLRVVEIDSPSIEILTALRNNIALGTSNTILEYYIFINPYEGSEPMFMNLPERGWMVKSSFEFDVPDLPIFDPSTGWVLDDYLSSINYALREFGSIDNKDAMIKFAEKLIKLTKKLLKLKGINMFKIKSVLGVKNDYTVHALTDIIRGNTTSLVSLKHNEFILFDINKTIKKGIKIFRDAIKIRFSGLSGISNETLTEIINLIKDGLNAIDSRLAFLNDEDKNILSIAILLKILKDENKELYEEIVNKHIGGGK